MRTTVRGYVTSSGGAKRWIDTQAPENRRSVVAEDLRGKREEVQESRATGTPYVTRVTSIAYDSLGREVSVTAPDTGTTRKEYDA